MQIKQLFFIAAFLSFCNTVHSQALTKVEQDSLMAIWKDVTQQDTIRLNAVQRVAMEGFRYTNPDSTLYYSQLQYDFANSIKNIAIQIRALNVQGDYYLLKGEPDTALDILNNALKLSENLSNQKVKLNTLGNISRAYFSKGDFDKALEYNLQQLKISEEVNDQTGKGMSLLEIGRNYVRKGDLTTGLDYLKRSKKIFEEINNPYYLVKVQSTMAPIYMQEGNPEKALELFTQNLAYYEEMGNKTYVAGCLSNIAGVYSFQGKNQKALEYLERAYLYFEELGNVPYAANITQNMGKIYQMEGNFDLSLEYLNKGLKLSEQIKDKRGVANANHSMGSIAASRGNHKQAINYINKALTAYQEMEDVNRIAGTSGALVRSYKATGNYKMAFEMNELHFKMRDSVNSKENQKAMIELQVQSDYDKQKAIDDLENEKQIAIETQKTKSQQRLTIAVGAGLLLISLLALGIFNRLKVTRKQKATIEEQKIKVEQSEKYKEQFLANMSHEIRTPMHAISGMVNILQRNEHPPSQDVFLNAMKTSSENLVVILNDVLDLSKIQAGKLEVENVPMSPKSVIENVVQLLQFKAEEKGLQLSYNFKEEIPDLVMGDPARMNQILINLVGNAIKFTEKGKVTISICLENEELKFSVMDTGIGIAKDKLEHIFTAFEQAKGSTARHYGGTGLGLNITKQLVELQRGKIWVDSEEGQGSTFYVMLPMTTASANAIRQDFISEENLKTMRDSLEGIRILIAEDNPFNQMIAQDDLSFYLKDATVDTVENGALAVEKYQANEYDLILMDVQMPEMNGFEATQKIREIENNTGSGNAIPIIAMTASLLKSEIDSCYDAGMNNYIPKPYKTEELIAPLYKELRS